MSSIIIPGTAPLATPAPLRLPEISSLALEPQYRNFWGSFDAAAIDYLSFRDAEHCYGPRYYKAPDLSQESIAAGDYLQYSLEIPPGSFIWGINHAVTGTPYDPQFLFQVLDTGLNHRWFNSPMPNYYFANKDQSQVEQMPWLLEGLYPVVAPGRFLVEFWNPLTVAQRCQMIFCVAVVEKRQI